MTKKITTRFLSLLLVLGTMFTMIPAVAHASSTQITGKSTISQTVYTGPSSSYYETAGSISANETVYILGKEKGTNWYHIQYHAGTKQKSGYVPTNTITSIQGGTVGEETYYGGYAVSNASQRVYSCDDQSIAVDIGGVGANESVTRLYAYGNVMYIEYNTSGKAKRGYVFNPNFTYPESVTCVARVTNSTSVSYGCKAGYNWGTTGTIGAGEYVAVIKGSASRNIAYVEYNAASGQRKRGYVSASNLDFHGGVTLSQLSDMYGTIGATDVSPIRLGDVAQRTYIIAGPGSCYAQVGYIDPGEAYYYDGEVTINGRHWTYVIYQASNGTWKSGFLS